MVFIYFLNAEGECSSREVFLSSIFVGNISYGTSGLCMSIITCIITLVAGVSRAEGIEQSNEPT